MAAHHARPHHAHRSAKHPGKGGTRHGFRSSNEIEDMEIFDEEPGKEPTSDHRHSPKSIDDNGYRERK
jgi:hypothetical protein